MRKELIALSSLIALWMGGCGGGETPVDQAASPSPEAASPTAVSPEPEASPPVAASPADVPPAPGAAIGEPSPQPSPIQGTVPPDLIASTNPEQRVQEIDRNRPDPFAIVTVTPTIEREVDSTTGFAPPSVTTTAVEGIPQVPYGVNPNNPPATIRRQTVGGQGPTAGTAFNPGIAARPGAGIRANRPGGAGATAAQNRGPISLPSSLQPGGQARPGGQASLTPVQPPEPPPPQPDLARAVQVTGVMQIGSTLHAIVKAPNEPTTRYVQVGQSLANGQVLVKGIDITGAQPVVILEQYGIEVRTAVGEGATPQQAPANPAA